MAAMSTKALVNWLTKELQMDGSPGAVHSLINRKNYVRQWLDIRTKMIVTNKRKVDMRLPTKGETPFKDLWFINGYLSL
jgi:hypothetical protein